MTSLVSGLRRQSVMAWRRDGSVPIPPKAIGDRVHLLREFDDDAAVNHRNMTVVDVGRPDREHVTVRTILGEQDNQHLSYLLYEQPRGLQQLMDNRLLIDYEMGEMTDEIERLRTWIPKGWQRYTVDGHGPPPAVLPTSWRTITKAIGDVVCPYNPKNPGELYFSQVINDIKQAAANVAWTHDSLTERRSPFGPLPLLYAHPATAQQHADNGEVILYCIAEHITRLQRKQAQFARLVDWLEDINMEIVVLIGTRLDSYTWSQQRG